MTTTKENKIIKIFLGLAVLCLVGILLLPMNAFLNGGDDYNFICDLQQNGILKNCINGYNDWDGRFLTLGAFVQAFCLLHLPIELTIFIWSVCFLFSGFLIYKIVDLETPFNFNSITEKYLILLLFPIIFWLGSFVHLPETVYWGTGGVYAFDLFLGAIWTYLFLKTQRTTINFIQKTGFLLLSVIVGATTQNLTICIITLVLITILIYFLDKKEIQKYNLLIFIGLFIGLLFISLAPGSLIRIDAVYENGNPNYNILTLLKNNIRMVYKYLKWSSILIFLTCFFTFSFHKVLNKNSKLNFKKLRKCSLKSVLIETKWFWVAISTLIPFITIPAVLSTRTSIYFMFFIFVFVVSFLNKIFSIFSISVQGINNKLPYIITFFLLIFSLSFISYNMYKSLKLKKAVCEREKILIKSKGKTAYLKLIDPKLNSFCYKLSDYGKTETEVPAWIIECQERFYKTKIVVIK